MSEWDQIGRMVRRDIERLKARGFDIREYTPEEVQERVAAMKPPKLHKQIQLPISDRIVQVRLIDEMVERRGIPKKQACDKVGITPQNYNQIKRLHGDKL